MVNFRPLPIPTLLTVLSGVRGDSSSSMLEGVRGRGGWGWTGGEGEGESLPLSSSSELEDELELLTSAELAWGVRGRRDRE